MFSQSKKLPIGGMSGRLIKLPMLALTANQCRYQNQRFPSHTRFRFQLLPNHSHKVIIIGEFLKH